MPADHLSLTFAALADPTRREILTRLAQGEATVNELATPFAVSLPAISRHLKVLEGAGLIVRTRDAQWRPSRLQAEPLDEAVEWLESRRRTWEARMDRLDPTCAAKGSTMSDSTPAIAADQEVLVTRISHHGPARRQRVSIGYEIVELVEPELIVLRSDPMPEV